jgi:hypothetical protein
MRLGVTSRSAPVQPEWVDIGPCEALWIADSTDGAVLILPGGRGAGAQPTLVLARITARRLRRSVLVVWDEYRGAAGVDEQRHWAEERAKAGLQFLENRKPLIVGKSLSSLAAYVPADRRLPALWYTPLVTEPGVADQIRAAEAPRLLVGGTADPSWNTETARSTGAEILEVQGADHSLEIDSDPVASARVLVSLAERTLSFMKRVPM